MVQLSLSHRNGKTGGLYNTLIYTTANHGGIFFDVFFNNLRDNLKVVFYQQWQLEIVEQTVFSYAVGGDKKTRARPGGLALGFLMVWGCGWVRVPR